MSITKFTRYLFAIAKPTTLREAPTAPSAPMAVTTRAPSAPSLLRVEVEIKTYKDSREKHSAQHHLSRISATNSAKPAPLPVCPTTISRCAPVAPSLVTVDIEAEIISDSGPDVLIHLFMISPSSFTRDICTAPAPTTPTSISPARISSAPITPAPASLAPASLAPTSLAPILLALTLLEPTLPPPVPSGTKSLPQDQEYDLILDTLGWYCDHDPDSALDDQLLEQREPSLYSNQDSDAQFNCDDSLPIPNPQSNLDARPCTRVKTGLLM
ncbi:hypothetical protein BG004_006870 [Podila humilis]|nr:hypothetical protein BG004_006870 [Podila humilis]